ncbi:MAG TPA: MFS transporter [Acetobacteraceae bacterium]|nr:MFS transporter [Acetobacteraceae bacterium]
MPTNAVPADGLPGPERFRAMITLGIAVAMSVLDSAIANIALPTIAQELHADPATSIWVVNAYQLAVTASLLPLASLGDIVGYRRVYWWGLLVFTVASAGCAAAQSLPVLVVARVLQGFGGAGIMSVNTALVRFVFPRVMLGRGIGTIAFVVATSAATGPTVAAAILSVASWHWLFAVNILPGILALYLAARVLPDTPRGRHRFDLLGAALNAVTLGLLLVAVDEFGRGESMLWAGGELALSLLLGFVFVLRERARTAPILPLDLFRRPVFALSVLTSICSYTAQGTVYVSLPFLFEDVGHLSQIATGLLMTPWPAIVVLIAPIAGRLSDRSAPALLGAMGLAVMTVGLALLLTMPADPGWSAVAWRMAVGGFGFGFFQSPNNRLLIGAAPPERSGGASGMLSTARLLGQTIGSALVALCFGIGAAAGGGIASGVRLSLLAGVIAAGGAMAVSFLRLGQMREAPAR